MKHSTFKQSILAGAVALSLGTTGTALADGNTNGRFSYDTSASTPMSTNSSNWSNSPNSSRPWNSWNSSNSSDSWNSSTSMDGKQRATTIGVGGGAVVGALVGGPVGAVIGAGVGGYVGNRGTDANGSVSGFNSNSYAPTVASPRFDADVQRAQSALTAQGYVLASDGIAGPTTTTALRDFQDRNGLPMTGTLDQATMARLGI